MLMDRHCPHVLLVSLFCPSLGFFSARHVRVPRSKFPAPLIFVSRYYPSLASTKPLRRPTSEMGSCFSKPTANNTPSLVTRNATAQEQSSPVRPQGVGAPRSSSQQQSGTQPRETPKASSDYIQMSAGEWDNGRTRVPSLTMIRPLEDFS
jgi:hypothetical protein